MWVCANSPFRDMHITYFTSLSLITQLDTAIHPLRIEVGIIFFVKLNSRLIPFQYLPHNSIQFHAFCFLY